MVGHPMRKNNHSSANAPSTAPAPKRMRRSRPQKALPSTLNVYLLPTLRMHSMEPARAGANDHLAIGRVGIRC